ncbi:MAG: hypothetical protein H0W84_01315 [Bacteroidetes bacterium]|nr:hypothetical protein [Bacteroidota bacterium]
MKKNSEFADLGKKLRVKTKGKLKSLDLTDEQYQRLITLLKIGISVVCCDKKLINVPLIDINQYVTSFAKDFNAETLIRYEDAFGLYLPTKKLCYDAELSIKIFGDSFINGELAHRLATRDLTAPPKGKTTGTLGERFEKDKAKYIKEFEKNDLKNVTIKKKKKIL